MERIDRLLDRMLASAHAGDVLVDHREEDRQTTFKRTPEGIDLVDGDKTTSLTLDDGRARLREALVQLDGEDAWQRRRPLGALESRWVPPASGIWRTEQDDILAMDGDDFVVIDATGAIQRRFVEIGMYPVAYVPAEDEAGVFYNVTDRALVRHDWEVSDIGAGRGSRHVELANLLADHDPETARFVAVVLGDAAVSAEEKRR